MEKGMQSCSAAALQLHSACCAASLSTPFSTHLHLQFFFLQVSGEGSVIFLLFFLRCSSPLPSPLIELQRSMSVVPHTHSSGVSHALSTLSRVLGGVCMRAAAQREWSVTYTLEWSVTYTLDSCCIHTRVEGHIHTLSTQQSAQWSVYVSCSAASSAVLYVVA